MGVCDPFRQNLRTYLINLFLSDLKDNDKNKFFLSIGKVTPWTSATGQDNDNFPPENIDSVKSDTEFWQGILAHKRIKPEHISLVIPRYDWERGQVFGCYRDGVDLYDDLEPLNFYVLVDEERVYKCIDNNNGGASIVAPTHTDSEIRQLSDNYRWKFLYQIPESRRRFITRQIPGKTSYMPIEYVDFLKENDDRQLQYNIQTLAVTGSINYVSLNESTKPFIVSDRVLFADTANQVVGFTASGSSTILLGGSNLVPQNDYYNNMVLKIESGNGIGQQRVISDYTYNSNGTALVSLLNPLNFSVTGGTGTDSSKYSILPYLRVSGDGESNNNTLNSYINDAELTVKFGDFYTGLTGQKYIDSVEVVNSGKNYTYASVIVERGLTSVPNSSASLSGFAVPVISPFGGHGSNPVKELGNASLMIVTEFSQDENDKLSIENDYRQFGILVNPDLNKSRLRLYFREPGISGDFVVGGTAFQGMTSATGATGLDIATGYVEYWKKGLSGYPGTSELILTNVSGDYEIGGLVKGYEILNKDEVSKAGFEGRNTLKLKLAPLTGSTFDPSALDYTSQFIAVGVGLSSAALYPSYANGVIYSWEPETGTNTVGSLYLEGYRDSFKVGEAIAQIDKNYLSVQSPKGKVIEISKEEFGNLSVYSQTYQLRMQYNGDGVHYFDEGSFPMDSLVVGLSGSTEIATGVVVGWEPSLTTGDLRLSGVNGDFVINNTMTYLSSGLTYVSTVSSVISSPDIKYHSGEVLHIQNIRPVERSIDQKEEIKFVIDF